MRMEVSSPSASFQLPKPGMYASTRSSSLMRPCSASIMADTAVDMDLLHDAMSNTVEVVIFSFLGTTRLLPYALRYAILPWRTTASTAPGMYSLLMAASMAASALARRAASSPTSSGLTRCSGCAAAMMAAQSMAAKVCVRFRIISYEFCLSVCRGGVAAVSRRCGG